MFRSQPKAAFQKVFTVIDMSSIRKWLLQVLGEKLTLYHLFFYSKLISKYGSEFESTSHDSGR